MFDDDFGDGTNVLFCRREGIVRDRSPHPPGDFAGFFGCPLVWVQFDELDEDFGAWLPTAALLKVASPAAFEAAMARFRNEDQRPSLLKHLQATIDTELVIDDDTGELMGLEEAAQEVWATFVEPLYTALLRRAHTQGWSRGGWRD